MRHNPTLTLIALLIAGAVVAWWVFFGSPRAKEDDDFLRLMRLVRGDHAMAERLVSHELKRAPTLTRHEAIRDAIQRLGRDRR